MRLLPIQNFRPWRQPALAALAALYLGCAGGAPETASNGGAATSPAGAPIVPVTAAELQQRVLDAPGSAVLVNVWATWCAPCREELPDLVRLQHDLGADGFQLFLISADFDLEEDDVQGVLAEEGVDFETFFKNEKDMPFIETMHPEWSGALPASFLYDDTGRLVRFWEGKATYQEFHQEIESILKPSTLSASPTDGGNES